MKKFMSLVMTMAVIVSCAACFEGSKTPTVMTKQEDTSSENYEELYEEAGVVGDLSSSYFDFDDDDIPEMAVFNSDVTDPGLVEVYTIKDGEVVDLGSFGQYGTIMFNEDEKLLVSENETGSGYYVIAYKLVDGELETVVSLKKDFSDFENIKTYVDDTEVDSDQFADELSKYTDNVKLIGASAQ
ncbi:hypothetical protein [Butyrivibrio sp. WCE2006]|uniref:hypothetical protein n=1 Tax=Butyrivibrio sp. WCE2006 TaxID=1410611 RepID=UPI0005D294FC|nr:hypothetical protein [Butyrivibrio sp. WCE2006]